MGIGRPPGWLKELTGRNEIRTEVFDFIEGFYNRRRRHSYLGWISPTEFEQEAGLAAAHMLNEDTNTQLEKVSLKAG